MKKLMITTAVAALAIGAYAEFTPFTETFDTPGEWDPESYGWTVTPEKEYTLTVTEGQYLSLETEPDGPLSKGIEETTDNVYVDANVKFTAFEDAEPTIAEDAKIAVWLKTTDNGDDTTTTKLMVTAGQLDDAASPTAESIALDYDVDPAQWYQLKIESVGNIKESGDALLGFKIKINDEYVAASESFITEAQGVDGLLTADARSLGAKLFPAITSDTTIKALALAGTGAIDDITIDATAAEVEVDIELPESDKWVATSDTEKAVPGTEIDVTLTANEGFRFVGGETEVPVKGKVETNGNVTIIDEPETEAGVAMIGDDWYFTLKEAFDEIPAKAEEVELDIMADCQYEDGFELKESDVLVIFGTIDVDKTGIKLMTTDTRIEGEGIDAYTFVISGLTGYKAEFDEESGAWQLVKDVVEPVLPTAKSEEIEADGLQAAAKFTLINKGEGYDDWNADFIVTFDQDIEEGAVTLKGTYVGYPWQPLPNAAYTKDEGKGVMATLGKTINVSELAALNPAEFLCGITNNSVKAVVNVKVQLVITDGETTKEIGEAFEAILPAAAAEEESWDVPEGKEDAPASEVWPTIPTELAEVNATALSTWATNKGGVDFAKKAEIITDAFLLNCANTGDAVEAAAKEFKIEAEDLTKILEAVQAGQEIPALVREAYPNAKIVVTDVTLPGADTATAKFWKAELKLK